MDPAVVQAAQQGCQDAQAGLYQSLFPDVVRYVVSRGASWEEAEDAAQDAILISLDRLENLSAASALPAYAKTIARRLWLQRSVGDRRREQASRALVGGPVSSPESEFVAAEDATRAWAAFERLSDHDRGLIRDRVLHEQPIAEVASQGGVTPASARVLVSRARKALREAWSSLGVLVGLALHRFRRGIVPDGAPVLGQATLAAVAVVAVAIGLPPLSGAAPEEALSVESFRTTTREGVRQSQETPIKLQGAQAGVSSTIRAVPDFHLADQASPAGQDVVTVVEIQGVAIRRQDPAPDPDVELHGPDGLAVRIYADQHVPDEGRVVWSLIRDALPVSPNP